MSHSNLLEQVKKKTKLQFESCTLDLGILGINLRKSEVEEVSPGLVSELLMLRRIFSEYDLKLELDVMDEGLQDIVDEYEDDKYLVCYMEEYMSEFLEERQEVLYTAFMEIEKGLYGSKQYIEFRKQIMNQWMDLLDIFDYIRRLEYNYQNQIEPDDLSLFHENLIALQQIFRDVKKEIEDHFRDLALVTGQCNESA